MVQFDHKQKFMKIQRKNASLYTNTHFIAKIMFMDIWMIFMRKKKVCFITCWKKSNYSKFSLEIKQNFHINREKKKAFENSFNQKIHFARIRSH